MLNIKTNERSKLNMVLVTARNDDHIACAAINHSDDSGYERTAVKTGDNADAVAMGTLRIAIEKNITGKGLEIQLVTDSEYLNNMFNGGYRNALLNREEIDYQEDWNAIINHLKNKNCRIVVKPIETINEIVARAKATAEFWAPVTVLQPKPKKRTKKATATAPAKEEAAA